MANQSFIKEIPDPLFYTENHWPTDKGIKLGTKNNHTKLREMDLCLKLSSLITHICRNSIILTKKCLKHLSDRTDKLYILFIILGRSSWMLRNPSLQRRLCTDRCTSLLPLQAARSAVCREPTLPGDSHLAGSCWSQRRNGGSSPNHPTNSWFAFPPTISGSRLVGPLTLQGVCNRKGCCNSWAYIQVMSLHPTPSKGWHPLSQYVFKRWQETTAFIIPCPTASINQVTIVIPPTLTKIHTAIDKQQGWFWLFSRLRVVYSGDRL